MTVTLEDVILELGNTRNEILVEVRKTKDVLIARVGTVEKNVHGLQLTARTHGREIGEVKSDLKQHQRSADATGTFKTPVDNGAIEEAVAAQLKKSIGAKDLKFYASLGAFVAGGTLTALNLFGVF